MKIGITTEEPDMEAFVAQRFGLCRYLLVVDSETLSFEAVPNPGASAVAQSGIEMVILAISHGAEVVVTGFISPTAHKHLTENGIRVIQEVQGKASAALKNLEKDMLERASTETGEEQNIAGDAFLLALKRSARQFTGLLPVMAGVILLIGLFKTFLSKEMLSAVFSGNALQDAFWGTCLGSLFTGNPINSYLIGAGLLDQGVSLFGITAFMVAWVCVGLLQLPAEIAALGRRFALARTGLCFCLAMAISISTSGVFYLVQG
jgi:predicted Fe-Mo cluster-binding NifX family protein